jgi:hypothetical protein
MYVLRKDLSKPGISPYVLDNVHGDMPRSSVDVVVQLKPTPSNPSNDDDNTGALTDRTLSTKKIYRLDDYLSIPPPRTTQSQIIKQRLVEQYPDDLKCVDDIEYIALKPFTEQESGEDLGINEISGLMPIGEEQHHVAGKEEEEEETSAVAMADGIADNGTRETPATLLSSSLTGKQDDAMKRTDKLLKEPERSYRWPTPSSQPSNFAEQSYRWPSSPTTK